MKVSELARKAGTTAKTVRFYEAEGILPAPSRSPNGYREYQPADLCRARVVVALRSLGLDLPEAGRLATMCATGRCDESAADLAVRIPERRREVALAMAELAHLDEELASIERALATGETPNALCSRKEDC
jgi:MerR family copper efflux transcriptional regulator